MQAALTEPATSGAALVSDPTRRLRDNLPMAGGAYVLIALTFGIATGVIARAKGSSFLLWFLIGGIVPLLGLIVVILYRGETREPERLCPNCGKDLKLYVQVCPRCGTDLYLPDPSEVRPPGAGRTPTSATRP